MTNDLKYDTVMICKCGWSGWFGGLRQDINENPLCPKCGQIVTLPVFDPDKYYGIRIAIDEELTPEILAIVKERLLRNVRKTFKAFGLLDNIPMHRIKFMFCEIDKKTYPSWLYVPEGEEPFSNYSGEF